MYFQTPLTPDNRRSVTDNRALGMIAFVMGVGISARVFRCLLVVILDHGAKRMRPNWRRWRHGGAVLTLANGCVIPNHHAKTTTQASGQAHAIRQLFSPAQGGWTVC
jgi:hypothetical protein